MAQYTNLFKNIAFARVFGEPANMETENNRCYSLGRRATLWKRGTPIFLIIKPLCSFSRVLSCVFT